MSTFDDGLVQATTKALRHGQSIAALARTEGCSESHIRSRLTLAFLSPDIQRAILTGQVPPQWTTDHLLNQNLPPDWAAQPVSSASEFPPSLAQNANRRAISSRRDRARNQGQNHLSQSSLPQKHARNSPNLPRNLSHNGN